jgi:hypothetical protein
LFQKQTSYGLKTWNTTIPMEKAAKSAMTLNSRA